MWGVEWVVEGPASERLSSQTGAGRYKPRNSGDHRSEAGLKARHTSSSAGTPPHPLCRALPLLIIPHPPISSIPRPHVSPAILNSSHPRIPRCSATPPPSPPPSYLHILGAFILGAVPPPPHSSSLAPPHPRCRAWGRGARPRAAGTERAAAWGSGRPLAAASAAAGRRAASRPWPAELPDGQQPERRRDEVRSGRGGDEEHPSHCGQ